ncbi:MAG: hypothetical protein GY862_08180 [Gammaproteobacteria bacterium]|nr:hypothetical protein [Gammaproteobacteria bacterium]
MHEIVKKIETVKQHHTEARYLEAYQALHRLCADSPQCDEFASAAASILSRFNDLNNEIMHDYVDYDQQQSRKREIRHSYELLIQQMNACFQDKQPFCDEDQTLHMWKNRSILRNTLHTIEDDLEECWKNEAKRNVLRNIREQLNKVIRYFDDLIKNSHAIQNYD